MTPLVSILTFCAHPSFKYAALLVFDTLRVGFPTARVEVIDNASISEVLPEIRAAAERVGASFSSLEPGTHWGITTRAYSGSGRTGLAESSCSTRT